MNRNEYAINLAEKGPKYLKHNGNVVENGRSFRGGSIFVRNTALRNGGKSGWYTAKNLKLCSEQECTRIDQLISGTAPEVVPGCMVEVAYEKRGITPLLDACLMVVETVNECVSTVVVINNRAVRCSDTGVFVSFKKDELTGSRYRIVTGSLQVVA